jgi:hypothetical protein
MCDVGFEIVDFLSSGFSRPQKHGKQTKQKLSAISKFVEEQKRREEWRSRTMRTVDLARKKKNDEEKALFPCV